MTTFTKISRKDKVKWLKFISDYTKKNGWPPSIREIQARFRRSSTSVVDYRLNKLVKDGYLYREFGVARGLRITDEGFDLIGES